MSSNGNIFRIIVPLWGESTGDRWTPKASDAELWCFLRSVTEQTVEQTVETPSRPLWHHCNAQIQESTHQYSTIWLSVAILLGLDAQFISYHDRNSRPVAIVGRVIQEPYHNFKINAVHVTTGCMQNSSTWTMSSNHYCDIIMGAMSQITSLTIVYSTVYSGADQRKHQSSASLAYVRGIHRWPVNYPHKGPVTRKMLPFDDHGLNERVPD